MTASSNAACDELTERLAQVLDEEELFRWYAKTFNSEKLSDKIKSLSNFRNGQFGFPTLEYLYQFRVVVCTLLTAGCITRARKLDKHFDSGHFSFTIIDEAACAPESVAMVSIAGAYCFHLYA